MAHSTKSQILLAPLQGLTDFRFRNAFHKYFGGIDVFYSPWICLSHSKEMKKSHITNLLFIGFCIGGAFAMTFPDYWFYALTLIMIVQILMLCFDKDESPTKEKEIK